MHWHFTVLSAVMLGSALIAALTGWAAWQRRRAPGGYAIALLMLAIVVWSFGQACEAVVGDLPAKILWAKFQYIGIVSIGPLWLRFALDYSRESTATVWRSRWLWLFPVVTLLVVATNEAHHWLWLSVRINPDPANNLAVYEHGWWYVLTVAYSYTLMFVGSLRIIHAARRLQQVYRHQLVAALAAAAIPWLGNVIYQLGLSPTPGLDLTTPGFALTGVICVWGLLRLQLLDLMPVARAAIMEQIGDGVLVLDMRQRIVDLNSTALELLDLSRDAIGWPVAEALAQRPELAQQLTSAQRCELMINTAPPRYLDLRSSPLADRRGVPTGRLLVLRDVTEYKRIEQQARQSEERLRQMIDLVPNFIFAKDVNGRFVLANQAVANAYGTTVEQLVGKTDGDFANSDDEAQRFRADDLAVIRSGQPLTVEEKITTARGETQVLETTKIPFRLSGSDSIALLGVSMDITARRLAEDALITSESLYHTLVETLPVNIFRKDLDGRFTYANQRYCRTQNKALSDIIGKTDYDLHPPELAEKYRADDRRIINSGQTFETDESYQVIDGQASWVHTLKTPQYAPDGRIIGVQGLFWDVTERKRAEEVLAQRTREMAALYETALDINTQMDLHTLLQAIVRRAAELLGARMGGLYLLHADDHTLELVVGHNLPRQYLGNRLKPGEGLSGQIALSGETMMVEDYQAWAGRSPTYVGTVFRRVLGVPLKVGGRIIGVINISDDQRVGHYTPDQVRLASVLADHAAIAIEKVRLLDETLLRAERLALLNRIARAIGSTLNLNDLMEIIYREVARVMAAETFFVALYDQQTNELDFRIRLDRDVREQPVRYPLQSGLTEKVVSERQPLLIRNFDQEKDQLPPVKLWGTQQPALSMICVPMLMGERVVGVISVQAYRPYVFGEPELELLTTIADTVAVAVENARLFDASQHHAEDLEARVAARTQELTRAYDHLQDLDRLKDEFVSRISHELRTPIANMQLYQGLLARGRPEKQAEYLQTLQRETARLNKLIEDLLAISQLDMGQEMISYLPVDVNRLLVHLQPDWQTTANERGLALAMERASQLSLVVADLPLLTRAVTNLVSNAFNYTPAGGQVSLTTEVRERDGSNWVTITVRDTGPGLNQDELPHVFERFYRGRAARNYKVPGTGLGLAMCQEIMDKLGGRVTVESVEGQGATFTLWLRPA